jgi:hypothetical protein
MIGFSREYLKVSSYDGLTNLILYCRLRIIKIKLRELYRSPIHHLISDHRASSTATLLTQPLNPLKYPLPRNQPPSNKCPTPTNNTTCRFSLTPPSRIYSSPSSKTTASPTIIRANRYFPYATKRTLLSFLNLTF